MILLKLMNNFSVKCTEFATTVLCENDISQPFRQKCKEDCGEQQKLIQQLGKKYEKKISKQFWFEIFKLKKNIKSIERFLNMKKINK